MVFSKWFKIWPRLLESQLALTQDLKLKEVMYFFVFRKISFYSFSIHLFGRKIGKIIWRTFKAMYPRLVNKNNVFFFQTALPSSVLAQTELFICLVFRNQ